MTWYSFKVISTCTHICIHAHMQRPGKIMTKNDDGDNSRVVELDVHFFLICIFKMFFSVHVSQACFDSTSCQHRGEVSFGLLLSKMACVFSLIGKVLRSDTSGRPACLCSLRNPSGHVHPWKYMGLFNEMIQSTTRKGNEMLFSANFFIPKCNHWNRAICWFMLL